MKDKTREGSDFCFRMIMSVLMLGMALITGFHNETIASAIFWLNVILWRYL